MLGTTGISESRGATHPRLHPRVSRHRKLFYPVSLGGGAWRNNNARTHPGCSATKGCEPVESDKVVEFIIVASPGGLCDVLFEIFELGVDSAAGNLGIDDDGWASRKL